MADDKDPWFVLERSEAVAVLRLTGLDGVDVVSRRSKDDGTDLVVAVGGTPPTRLFLVQVKGTLSANREDWSKNVKQLIRLAGGNLYLPTCVFVVKVRDNSAHFAWLAEPTTTADRAVLTFHPSPTFHALDDAALADLVERVKAFYDAVPRLVATTA